MQSQVQQYQVQSQVQQLQPQVHQVQHQIQVQPQPEWLKTPEKKLSPAENQRRKINAASEYFKKLRENAAIRLLNW